MLSSQIKVVKPRIFPLNEKIEKSSLMNRKSKYYNLRKGKIKNTNFVNKSNKSLFKNKNEIDTNNEHEENSESFIDRDKNLENEIDSLQTSFEFIFRLLDINKKGKITKNNIDFQGYFI